MVTSNKLPKVTIYDTTLRDGTQGEGVSFSADDKLKIALRLDKLGIHYIEGGWPGSNPKDAEFFRKASKIDFKNSQLTAFCSTRRPGQATDEDSNLQAVLASGVRTAALVGKSWDFQVLEALKTSLEENLLMIEESVAFLKEKGLKVFYDAEHFFDGYRSNPWYALQTIKAARKGGADLIVLCDTNGGSLPDYIFKVVGEVSEQIAVPVGIHAHNDCELAVANSLMAYHGGAVQIQGTINGYGERCGNANLCSVIPNLILKEGVDCLPRENLKMLTEVSRFVSEMANMSPPNYLPYVGSSAFAHKAGIHVSALLKNPLTYEHIDPEKVGNKRKVLVSELAGSSNLRYMAEQMKLDISENDNADGKTREILDQIKQLEHQGFQFEGAEASMELLLRKAYAKYQEPFKLEQFRTIMEMRADNAIYSEAVIKLKVGEKNVHTAAEGNGPVNALDNALRKALADFYPEIKDMKLTDYKVRVLNENAGTEAAVRVLNETSCGAESWGTVGVSTNIIEASWHSLVDSLAYGILKMHDADEKDKE